MNKKVFLSLIFIFLLFMYLPVNASSDYYKDITISFNSNGCPGEDGKSITIQLFKDGEIEGDPVVLNKSNNYTHTYQDLFIFGPETPDEIKYDVKVLENGKYRLLSPKHQTYKKEHIQKWVQVPYEYIKDGHTYVITTDNWNYENNGFSKIIYLRGDVTAKGAQVLPEYNIINGMKSFYVIDGEPIDNTKWTATKSNNNTWIFTNESEGKYLTLTGYLRDSGINYIFKRSGKTEFVSDTEYNSNKMQLTYVEGSKGRFYIGTHTNFPDVDNNMQYITLSGQNQYQAGSDMSRAAQFKAFEYVDTEVEVGETVTIEESMCPTDEVVIDTNSNYKRNINISFDCTGCESKKESGITLQLFADGKKVQDGEVILNNKNGFNYVYEDLPVFADGTFTEINYEVKALINGKYYSIAAKDINYKKEKANRWIQVLPKDIKDGHTYTLVAENLDYESNKVSKYVYLRGDTSSRTAGVDTEYNVVNGNKLYYVLKGDPSPNTKWTASNVPTDDPDYSTYKNYFMFTNENEDKKLTLTAYINQNDGTVNWIYKRSGNSGWVNDYELNTNRVTFTPIDNSNGKFYISTFSLLDPPYNEPQYLAVDYQNNFYAEYDREYAAPFLAFEYVEKEIVIESQMVIESNLCEVLAYPNMSNPKTGYNILIIICLITLSSLSGYIVINNNKKRLA